MVGILNFHKPESSKRQSLGVVKLLSVKSPKEPESMPFVVDRHSVKSETFDKVYGPPKAGRVPDRRAGIAIVGRFKDWPWGQHPDEAYLAEAIESLGIPVYRTEPGTDMAMAAEWVLFTAHPDSRNQLKYWSRTHKTILWTLDWLPDYSDRRTVIEMGRRVHLFVTSDQFDWRRGFGIYNHFYLPGACERRDVPFSPNPKIPCAFLGSLYNSRRRAIEKLVLKHHGVVLSSQRTWVYGSKLSSFVQQAKVIVGDNVRNDVRGYWSTRNYVIPGAGGFLLTASVPGLERDFVIGKHITVYRNLDELDEGMKICIENDKERETVRRLGFEHVRKHHSWDARARMLMNRIGLLKEVGT